MVEVMKEWNWKMRKVEVVMDLGGGELFERLIGGLDEMSDVGWMRGRILFVDGKDKVVV
ncbi:hypothetical protein [Bacillus pumilus]|uniref:hypothetical protein n=1 Tax=Bacillus pumilus TaxID=1408 RepID=UPI0011A71984|nr:hypothetical protein [Bacillus pumilus]